MRAKHPRRTHLDICNTASHEKDDGMLTQIREADRLQLQIRADLPLLEKVGEEPSPNKCLCCGSGLSLAEPGEE